MKLRAFLTAMALLCGAVGADAASIPLFNPQNLFLPGTGGDFNTLINQINGILSPLTGSGAIIGAASGTGATAINIIQLVPGVSGSPAQISLQAGGDSNGSIQILPDLVGGDIILFGSTGSGGNLVFANAAMWVPATGLARCPGVLPGQGVQVSQAAFGPAETIQGYWVFEDWLDRPRFTPSC